MIIKKLNGMFHKHGRWLFGIITVVIIVSFVGFLAPGQFGFEGFSGPGDAKVGTAFGKDVTWNDVQKHGRMVTLFQYMFYGQSMNVQPQQLFFSYCTTQAIARKGIVVSDKEVVKFIQEYPQFQTDGKFDIVKYRNVTKFLNDRGFSDGEIADAIRMALAQQKLQKSFEDTVVITPDEVEQFFRAVNSSFAITAKSFAAADYRNSVKPDGKKLQEFFKANQKSYMIPSKASGLVAKFPYANYTAKAAKVCSAADVEKYFAAHRQDFAVNGKVPEFKTIAAKVRAAAVADRAGELARAAAYEFADAVYNVFSETAADKREAELRKIAAGMKVVLTASGMVEASASPMAAQLNKVYGTSNPLTEIVNDGKTASVGVALKGIAERPAKITEVADKVKADYINAEAMKLAQKAAADFRAALVKAKDMKAKTALFAAKKGKNSTFVFSSKQNPPAGMEMVAYSIYNLKTGDVSEVIPGQDAASVALLTKRTPADMKELAAVRVQYEAMCRSRKAAAAMAGFEEELSAQCQLDPKAFERQ